MIAKDADRFCVVCAKENPPFEVIDAITGFSFCGDCFNRVRRWHDERYTAGTLSNWLRSLADVLEQHYR